MADQIMAESKTHKSGLLRRILWWLWVILLTALLVLGFVFAAPWKIITLIAIFLASATILPRIYRKWFWLGVGIVVLATIAWIFLPDDNKGWQPYTFDKELAQLQARYAVPDSENAAIAYNKILADWKQKEANEPNLPHDWQSIALKGFWLSKDQPEIAAYVQYYQNTIEQLVQTSKLERCSFPITATPFITGEQLKRNAAMRLWARLLVATGNNDIAEGNTDEAIEKYLVAIRMGQNTSQQPSALDFLVGIACEALAMGGVNNFVVCGDTNEFYLNKLAQTVSAIKHDWNTDLLGFITFEKWMLKNQFGGSFYEVNSKGKTRLSRDQSAMIREELKKQLDEGTIDNPEIKAGLQKAIICPGYWLKKIMKTYVIPTWFYAPATPEKLGEIIDASFEKHYAMTKPDFDWSKESEMPPGFHYKINIQQLVEIMAKINKGIYPALHDNYLRIAAQQRETLLIIAMKRYKNANGHWPEKLEDIKNSVPPEILVDPFNGDSFVYKRTEENFTLYSKGKNGIDEEGKLNNKGCDDLVIWPIKNKVSKQQEQKAKN